MTLLITPALSKTFLSKAEFSSQPQVAVKDRMTASAVWYHCLDSTHRTSFTDLCFHTAFANISVNKAMLQYFYKNSFGLMDLLEGSRGTRGLQNALGEPLFKCLKGVSVVNLKKKRLVIFHI